MCAPVLLNLLISLRKSEASHFTIFPQLVLHTYVKSSSVCKKENNNLNCSNSYGSYALRFLLQDSVCI